jgi:hypothetical protein
VSWVEPSNQAISGGDQGSWSRSVFGALSAGPARVLAGWGFNTRGQLRVDVDGALANRLLPIRDLSRIHLRSSMALIVDDWALPDGADSVMREARAGQHREGHQPSGLYRQVRRMAFLGIRDRLEGLPAISSVLNLLRSVAPNPIGTYVVSHNYAPDPESASSRECHLPGYPEAAAGGLNNLAKFSKLDSDRPKCFETAPFRDQASYDDSLYVQLFLARGGWFMGCKNAQADDPSAGRETGNRGSAGGCE